VIAASFLLHDLWHPLAGRGYQFWSGIGSDVTELAMLGWLYAFLRRHNCHARRCWRLGRHPVAGTDYIVCRRHHPQDTPTAAEIHAAARAAREPRTKGAR
jgi:hypothetical protein